MDEKSKKNYIYEQHKTNNEQRCFIDYTLNLNNVLLFCLFWKKKDIKFTIFLKYI